MNDNNNLDILSMLLDDSLTQSLKNSILENPLIAEENNYHLLMLACWCDNKDIILFLFQDSKFILNAFANKDFSLNMQNLKLFNSNLNSLIQNLYNAILLSKQLDHEIPANITESSLIKF